MGTFFRSQQQGITRLNTTLTEAQKAVFIEFCCSLLLPFDGLLVVTREFINADVSRAGLDRCLRRHGIPRLTDLIPKEDTVINKHKAFKSHDPGFFMSKSSICLRCQKGSLGLHVCGH